MRFCKQLLLTLFIIVSLAACESKEQATKESETNNVDAKNVETETITDVSEKKPAANTEKKQEQALEPLEIVSLEYFNSPEAFTDNITSILKLENIWDEDFDHKSENRLLDVSKAIIYLAQHAQAGSADLDKLLYYLRAYSYLGPIDDLSLGEWQSLDEALHAVAKMKDFLGNNDASYRLNEHYVVSLYRYYPTENMERRFEPHIAHLTKLLGHLSSQDSDSEQYEFALWETLRSYGFLPYFATDKRARKEHLAKVLGEDKELTKAIQAFAQSKAVIHKNDQWPLKNVFWILAQTYRTTDKDGDKKLDKIAWSIAEQFGAQFGAEYSRKLFTQIYLINTYRGKSECEGEDEHEQKEKEKSAEKDSYFLKGKCLYTKEDEVLPIKHTCSDGLYIRAQKLTEEELKITCEKLIDKEDFFHETLKTNRKPVPNDFNQVLKVVIFDHFSYYNRNGQLVFDFNTDNGGFYIEGSPQNPENVPTFISYEAHWLRPELVVWNLGHEYIHYLDGRYVAYGAYGNFESHVNWWIEGIAEYVSMQGKENKRAIKLLAKTKVEDRPDLHTIFKITYADGLDFNYHWSWYAQTYLWENHAEDMLALKNFFNTDYFEGYKNKLKEMEAHQEGFAKFLQESYDAIDQNKLKEVKQGPRKLYHYSYRPYLLPPYLKPDEFHHHRE